MLYWVAVWAECYSFECRQINYSLLYSTLHFILITFAVSAIVDYEPYIVSHVTLRVHFSDGYLPITFQEKRAFVIVSSPCCFEMIRSTPVTGTLTCIIMRKPFGYLDSVSDVEVGRMRDDWGRKVLPRRLLPSYFDWLDVIGPDFASLVLRLI